MKKKKSKRVCALFLSITMFASLFAGINVPSETVRAASSATIDDMTALDALGIDTNEAPSGYDENSTDNPYGRDITTASEVDELFVMHGAKGTTFSTYGYDSPVLSSTQNEEYLLNHATSCGESETISSLPEGLSDYTIAVEGNFSYDNKGQKKQVAYLSAVKEPYVIGSDWISSGQYAEYTYGYRLSMNLGVMDTYTKEYSLIKDRKGSQKLYEDYCLCKGELPYDDGKFTVKHGHDISEYVNYKFKNPYVIMNYLKMAVGDYDGDGIDEIAFYKPIYDQVTTTRLPAVEIYDLRVMEKDGYMDAANWSLAKTINLERYCRADSQGWADLCPNMVSLSAGDFDKDGTDDLAISYGYYGTYGSYDTKTNVYFGERAGKLLARSVSMTRDDIYRVGLSTGDVDGDGYNELVMGGSIKDGDHDERYVGVYEWNGSSFSMSSEKKIDIYEQENGQYVYKAAENAKTNRGYEEYYSSPVNTANVTIGRFNGLSEPACIYIDGLLIEMGDSGLDLIHMVDDQLNRNSIAQSSRKDYVEWGARAVDLNGDGTDTLVVTRIQSNIHSSPQAKIEKIIDDLFGLKDTTETIKVTAVGTSKPQRIWGNTSSSGFIGAAFAVPNLDNDTTIMTYKKQHYYTYSDPEILAVLASPPYYKELDTDDYAAVDPNATSYGSSKGSGGGDTYSNSFYVGVYTSYEHEFKIFGVPVASVEAEFEMKNDFTWETERVSSMEYQAEYETYQGQDTVVLYSIPVETYVYTAQVPVFDDDGKFVRYDTQDMTVNIPHEPTIKTLPLDDYEVIAKDYDELPQIAGNVLTHEMGNPSSYPSSKAELPASGSGMPVLIAPALDEAAPSTSFGLASQTRSIDMSSEETNSFNYEFEINTKAGAGAGDVKVGVTAGYSHGAGTVKISTAGSSYSGTIFDLSPNAKGYDYGFTWRLCAFGGETSDGKQFPVVTYLVTEAAQAPLLPADFEQSEEGTGQEQITLTWSDENTPAGYAIYRYFRSAGAADFYEVAYVSASDPDNYEYKDGARYYSYTDEGLSPDAEYQYKIQTIGASGGKKSVPSAVLTAYTKPTDNVPVVRVYPEKAVAYPDKPTILTAVLENEEILENAKIYYAWQKLNEDGRTWDNLNKNTASGSSYVINNAGIDDMGYYRCRVTCQKDQTMVSTYTDKVKVDYSKRTTVMSEFKLVGDTVSVRVAGSDTNSIPSGIVVFTLKAANYEKEIAAEVDEDGIASAELTAADGVYKLSATYNGSRVFKTESISKDDKGENIFYTKGLTSGTEYTYLDIGEYTYGDKLNIREYTINEDGTVIDNGEIDYSQAEFGRYFDLRYGTTNWGENERNFRSVMKFTDFQDEYIKYDDTGYPHVKSCITYTSSVDGKEYNELQIAEERFKAGYAGFAGDICLYYKGEFYSFNVAKRDATLWIDYSDLPDPLPYNDLHGTILSEDTDPNDKNGYKIYTDIRKRIKMDNIPEFDGTQQYGTDRDMIVNISYNAFGAVGMSQHAPIIAGVTYAPTLGWYNGDEAWYSLEEGFQFGFYGDGIDKNYGFSKASFDNLKEDDKVYITDFAIVTGKCYNFTFKDTSIEIAANTNTVHTEAVPVDGQKAGEISLVSPSKGKAFPAGTTLVFNAVPYDGYEIAGYEVIETPNKGEEKVTPVNSTSGRLVWTMKDCKTTVKAIFKVKENTLTFEASPSEAMVDGKVIGKNRVTGTSTGGISVESGKVISAGAELEFTHKAAKGWHFTGWEYFPEGAQTQYISDDVFTMTMPDSRVRLFAKFERDSYKLKLGDGLIAVDEDGNIIDTSEDIDGDTKITVKAKTGYSVTADSFTATAGVSDLDDDSETYTFTLLKNTEVSAEMSAKNCKVNVTAENGTVVIKDPAGNTIENGSSVSGGITLTFTAEADRGYKVSAWGNEASEKTTHTIVAEDNIDLNVTFAKKDSRVVNAVSIPHAESSYTVIENGKETVVNKDNAESDQITIYEGESLYVKVTPDKGFMMAGWNVSEETSNYYKSSTDKQYIIPYDSKITAVQPAIRSIATYDVNIGKDITATADGVPVTSGKIGSGVDIEFTFAGKSSEVMAWSLGDVIVPSNSNTYSIKGLDRSLDISVKAKHNYSEEWICDDTSHHRECDCGCITDEGKHEFVEVVEKVATSTEEGLKHNECRTCHYKQDDIIIPKVENGHVHSIVKGARVEATCETDGVVEYYYCSECGACAIDKATLESADTEEKLSACVIDRKDFFITKTGHKKVVDTSTIIGATCLSGEYTGDCICETCHKFIECGSVKDVGNHNFGYNSLVKWSWEATDTGFKAKATFDCEHCNEKNVVDATVTPETAGLTCETDGTTTYTAKVTLNGTEYTDVKTVATKASGHNISETWSKDKSAHWHACSNCDEKFDWAEHTWNAGEVTTEATAEAEGIKTYTCTKCGETKTEVIDKLAASATPEPTEEPGTSATPEPSEEPGTSATPEPTEEPGPSATPEPTEEPGPSATPEPTEEPGTSATPEPTEEPGTSATPEPSEVPSPTPVPSEGPGTSPTPVPSEGPGTSPTPVPSEGPGTSPTPVPSEEPGTSATPEPSEEPGTSATPEPSEEPGTSATPRPSNGPGTLPTVLVTGIKDGGVYYGNVKAKVDKKYVVSVTSNGKNIAISEDGTFTLSPTDGVQEIVVTDIAGNQTKMKITIYTSKNETVTKKVKVKSIKITGISKQIAVGKKIQLTANISPKNATNKQVTWKSSNEKYATVSSKGVVTTKKAGENKTVTITAIAKDGSKKKATYKIKIMPNAVKNISLKASKTVKAGKKLTIKATVTPDVSSKKINKTLEWSTSNKKYATVSSKGVVKTYKAGKGHTVTITAMSTDGTNKKAKIKIKIK